ncbi:hypothetical protein SELMODRAFT_77290 [Selaginella moellendorffii]|uniref:Uncharacterized protein n=2 Tax=Selaginella moellendorffii TaxID=88036 RepID=D8QTZ9_SELML|nr:hypothetical protein SELMODRAFT_77290 [Selaginella moellendorffii]
MILAPEQELTIVALRLAILEKAATGLGVLAFVWATVVLLGGFVTNIKPFDFWVVSALLLTEGTRVFSRSHELEWQHAAGGSVRLHSKLKSASSNTLLAIRSALSNIHVIPGEQQQSSDRGDESFASDACRLRVPAPVNFDGFHVKRTWSWNTVPLVPYSHRYFSARRISFILHVLQLASAVVTIGFSLARLIQQDYVISRSSSSSNQVRTNLGSGLNIFYSLSLVEASIFLAERAYLEYNLRMKELLVKVARKSQLGEDLLDFIRQFFYDVYSKCLKESIFVGLNLDLVTYSIAKIQSNSGNEQLGGVLMLSTLITQEQFLEDTLRTVGTTPGVTERLLEMITWRNRQEKEIRRSASKILCQLVIHKSNSFRVMAIAGALEGILTLLLDEGDSDEELEFDNSELTLHGLRMLKTLAKDDKNCVQIGNTRGLLSILVANIEIKGREKALGQKSQKKILKKTLQLLQRLVSTKGEHGRALKRDITKIVFTLPNLRDVLQHCGAHPVLRGLAVDIITSLALDDGIKENIAGTGGLVHSLLALFLKDEHDQEGIEFTVRLKAGEAVYLLVLKSSKNSSRVIRSHQMLESFIAILKAGNQDVSACAGNILRSIWPYLCHDEQLEIASETSWLLQEITQAHGKQLEAFLGLAASTVPVSTEILSNGRKELVSKVMNLTFHEASLELPRTRRHTVELALALMKRDGYFIRAFRAQGMKEQLQRMLDTISDVDNFITFSGAMGLTLHAQAMEELISLALEEVDKDHH